MREDWVEILYKDAVFKISTSKQKLKQKEYSQIGEFPVIDQGQNIIGGYSDDKERLLDCKLPVIVFGDHTKCVKIINFKFVPGADGTKVLEPKPGIEPRLIAYLTHVLAHKIKDKGYARHYQHIEKEKLPLPPLPEQRAIVAKIEELFSALDKGITDLKKAQTQLKIYRQAVLKKAFEGELTKVELREVIDNIKAGKSFRCEERPPIANEVGVLKVSAVTWGKFQENESKTVTDPTRVNPDYFVKEGDFLFSRANTIELVGNSVIVKKIDKQLMLSDKTLRITFHNNVSPYYILYFLRSRSGRIQIESLSTGNQASMRNIGQERIKQMKIPFPSSLEEQYQIVQEIESRLSVCDKVEQTISDSLEKAQALRQSILKKAFDGSLLSAAEIAACKTAPDYEPASVLLEKIKAEKEKT